MNSKQFQVAKFKRLLHTQGRLFEFTKPSMNEFGEPTSEGVSYGINGVFHTTHSYVSKSVSDGSVTRSKASPMIMCLWGEANQVEIGHEVTLNGTTYKVNGVTNINEDNLLADISIEEVQGDGRVKP